MPLLVVGEEKNLTALRARILPARTSASASRRVTEAIREANPDADFDALDPGTILVIPDLPRLGRRQPLVLDDPTVAQLGDLIDRVADGVGRITRDVGGLLKAEAEDRDSLRQTLQDLNVEGDDRLEEQVKVTLRTIDGEEAAAQDAAETVKAAQAEWTAELEALKALTGQNR